MRNLIIGGALIAGVAFGFGGITAPRGSQTEPMAIPKAAPGKSATAPRPIKENVVAYHTGDADMIAAKAKARKTLPRFAELIKKKTPGTYTIKFPLTQNGETEHIWMQLTGRKDGKFVGLLANKPVNGNQYRMGDKVEVAEADVEDWMVNGPEGIYGGYTARVMLKDMPKEQADALRAKFKD